jgi:hypothetical protein
VGGVGGGSRGSGAANGDSDSFPSKFSRGGGAGGGGVVALKRDQL